MPNVADLLRNHVSLSIACVDRLYVNGYMPKLQTSGQLCYFLREHLGKPIASPALFRPLHDRFTDAISTFASREQVPLVQFERGQRKDDVAAELRRSFTAAEGVVFVGVAQEKASSFKGRKIAGAQGGVWFDFSRQSVAVNHFYFYVHDSEWGPAFVKVGSYLPYPVKLCLNGHEWAKQQLRREGIGFESLDNGFLSCEQPDRLQEVCDRLGAADVESFFDRWSHRLPWPLTEDDRKAGYDHDLSIWQIETSLTQVFEQPVQGRHFFEAVIRDNLDLGRPDRVSLLFPHRHNRRTPPPTFGYRTRVLTAGVNPSLHVEYKHSHVKQYFKEERALRTETTINDPGDFYVKKGVRSLDHLRNLGKQINRKLLEAERVAQSCALSEPAFERMQRPTMEAEQRAPALRFGDARVMALLQALCLFFHLPAGFRNGDLRTHVAAFLGLDLDHYTPAQMSYDLRRLRLKGIVFRILGTNRYTVTTQGLRISYFFTKVHLRILRTADAAMNPSPAAGDLTLNHFGQHIERLCKDAQLRHAA